MAKILGMVKDLAGKFGVGAVLSGTPYVNGLLCYTAGLACFLIIVVFHMFGIDPGSPQETGNPISWILFLMVVTWYGWLIWSYATSFLMWVLGFAVSVLDLIGARKSGNVDLYRGAVAGICMAAIPISLWYLNSGRDGSSMIGLHGLLSMPLHLLPSAFGLHGSVPTIFIHDLR